jgi:hypothetical protein
MKKTMVSLLCQELGVLKHNVILALGRWKQRDHEFEFKTSLGYIVRPCFKQPKRKKKREKEKKRKHYVKLSFFKFDIGYTKLPRRNVLMRPSK